MDAADAAGVDVDVIRYLDAPPDEATLRRILATLEDPPQALVRRDDWKELGITAADIADADGVVRVLLRHPQLMERPVLVKGDRAIIGRPTERAEEFLRS